MKVSRLLTKTVRDPCIKISDFFLCRIIRKVAAASAVVFSLTCYCSIRRSASIQYMDLLPPCNWMFLAFFFWKHIFERALCWCLSVFGDGTPWSS